MKDIYFALRTMYRSPLFAGTVVLIIALAIGTSITMFSVVNGVLLRPLPFSSPDRVVQVAEKNDKFERHIGAVRLSDNFQCDGSRQYG